MASDAPLPPAPPGLAPCYRHPEEQTGVRCARCDRAICPRCMVPAPVGFHCPECVNDARREFRQGPAQAMRTTARGLSVTKVLIALIVAVWIVDVIASGGRGLTGASGSPLFEQGASFPPLIANGEYWRLLTPMFLHAGVIHLAFNAYVLWVFGSQVEEAFGSARMLAIYVVAGFLASVASYVFGPALIPSVGASGAIFGLAGAFIAYTYRRRDQLMANAQLRQALIFVLLNLLLGFVIEGIDWRAHLGGLVAGAAAGWFADPARPRQVRTLVTVGGLAGLVIFGIVLVAIRSEQLCAQFGCSPG